MLTEAQVERSFRRLFTDGTVSEERLVKAESLIDKLRLESPLRHRLTEELEELRRLVPADNS